ncbi:MAG: hypothetical protein AAGU15_07615 [Anaerolineaceae bacterium]|jgi:hypothetical protein
MKTITTILIALALLIPLGQVEQPVTASQNYQLNLSHIVCLGDYVEVHFVLLFTSEGDDISDLTYTYGVIPPGARTGNVVHFTDNVAPGYYNITSASVWVNGIEVTLHNPGAYAGYYGCQVEPTSAPTNTPTNTPTYTPVVPTNTPTNTPTDTPVIPTNTPTNTPTDTPVVPTNTPTNTPTDTPVVPTNTPTNTPTDTPVVPTETSTLPTPTFEITPTDAPGVMPTQPITTATFSVPNTGNDDSFLGPGIAIAGFATLGLGIALNTILRKEYAAKGTKK